MEFTAFSPGIKKGADAPIFLFPRENGKLPSSLTTRRFINDVVVDQAVLDGS